MLKTLKVELFSDSNLDDLQEQVNEFLYNIHPDDVKDVKLSSADGTYDILVIYIKKSTAKGAFLYVQVSPYK